VLTRRRRTPGGDDDEAFEVVGDDLVVRCNAVSPHR
jgi:hypothetical protein